MMIFTRPDIEQDTIKANTFLNRDSVILQDPVISKADSSVKKEYTKAVKTERIRNIINSDTTSVCSRNSIIDLTFHKSADIAFIKTTDITNYFPFLFTEINNQKKAEARTAILEHLKQGETIPGRPLHADWITGVILLATILYSLVSTSSKNMLPGVTRFFLFRGINDPSSRNIGGLFHWQSTIINFVSFLVISLFAYSVLEYFEVIPDNKSRLILWLITLGIVIAMFTLRHIICIFTGKASGQNEAFREYLLAIYQSYWFSALFLFAINLMIFYTVFLPSSTWYISGIIVFGLMYLIRITRLLVIFLNRKISIFYLILYLCALEILPVLIAVKYFTGFN
jgi:hypothetical protein